MSNAKQRRSQKRVLKAKGERSAKVLLGAMVKEGLITERQAKRAETKVQVMPGKKRCANRYCRKIVDEKHPMYNVFPDVHPGWCGKCCDDLAQAMNDARP